MSKDQKLAVIGLTLWAASVPVLLLCVWKLPESKKLMGFAAWSMVMLGGVAWSVYFKRQGKQEALRDAGVTISNAPSS